MCSTHLGPALASIPLICFHKIVLTNVLCKENLFTIQGYLASGQGPSQDQKLHSDPQLENLTKQHNLKIFQHPASMVLSP